MSNPDPSYNLRFKVRMGDVSGVKSILKQNGADLCAKGETLRGWTALHIAVWGTRKPDVRASRPVHNPPPAVP